MDMQELTEEIEYIKETIAHLKKGDVDLTDDLCEKFDDYVFDKYGNIEIFGGYFSSVAILKTNKKLYGQQFDIFIKDVYIPSLEQLLVDYELGLPFYDCFDKSDNFDMD